ncbi:MAG: thiamine pyrophosphate-binding protein [Chloroflexota bacterium]|nr:thiamine pyrophosphate-binding protein [Chloroflexota bacterium]
MNGADLLVQALRQRGIEFVTTLCGNGLGAFYSACARAGLRLVDFRNEQAASLAADTVARLTGRLAVCAVSSGGAHVNALVGLMNAQYDGAPLLLITGASEQSRTDMGKFQDLDQVSLAAPLCKYARLVDGPERLGFYVHEACSRALSGRGGPVHLTVPSDVLAAEVDVSTAMPRPARLGELHPHGTPDTALVDEVAALLERAERPILIAGSGAFYAGAGASLESFLEATDIPVMAPIWDRGVVSRPVEQFMGVIGAASGEPRLLPDADVVLLLGARVDYRIGYGEPPAVRVDARIVRIDVDPEELIQGREPDVALLADPASALAALARTLKERGFRPRRAWLAEAKRRYREFRARWTGPTPEAPPLTGRHIVQALQPLLTDDVVFLIDGGNIGQWAHVLADRYPESWLTCGPSGLVGWGVAGAIGAKLTYPDRPVILLSGDGSIGFGLVELETAVRHNTPFVAVLADDAAWGIVTSHQLKSAGPEGVIASRLGPVAYDRVAEGLGALGIRVESPEEIGPAVARGLASGRPTLVHVPIAVLGPAD